MSIQIQRLRRQRYKGIMANMNPESSTENNPPYGIIEQACQVLMNA